MVLRYWTSKRQRIKPTNGENLLIERMLEQKSGKLDSSPVATQYYDLGLDGTELNYLGLIFLVSN